MEAGAGTFEGAHRKILVTLASVVSRVPEALCQERRECRVGRCLAHHRNGAMRMIDHLLAHRPQEQAPEQGLAEMTHHNVADAVLLSKMDDLLGWMSDDDLELRLHAGVRLLSGERGKLRLEVLGRILNDRLGLDVVRRFGRTSGREPVEVGLQRARARSRTRRLPGLKGMRWMLRGDVSS